MCTAVIYTTSCLLLSKAFTLKLARILASFGCHWCLDAAVVVHVER
jgi:hypothetical protein